MKISIKEIITLLIIAIVTSSIGIPLRQHELKCMIVYTVGESDSVKIVARLP